MWPTNLPLTVHHWPLSVQLFSSNSVYANMSLCDINSLNVKYRKTPKITPWAYIFQRDTLEGLYSRGGGCYYGFLTISGETSLWGEFIKGVHIVHIRQFLNLFLLHLNVHLVFLGNKKCTLNFHGLIFLGWGRVILGVKVKLRITWS